MFPKVLVTGGAGFIGSHLVDKLVSMRHEVLVIDNLFTGEIENLQRHLADGTVRFLKGDIRDAGFANDCVRSVHAVVHLAAISSVPFSVQDPVLTNDVNVNGTLNFLRASVKNDVKKFVFVSSCAVYGEPCYFPVDEKHPTQPLSPYAASKVASEHYCRIFKSVYGLNTVILRPFNVYGSRQKEDDVYSGVITRFVRNLICEKPLIIYGDGGQTRDFVHVKDISEAISLALENDDDCGQVFNVGSGKETSIKKLAKLLIKIFGGETEIVHEKPRVGDLRRSCADISMAKREFRYKPKISFEFGLRSFLFEMKEKAGWNCKRFRAW